MCDDELTLKESLKKFQKKTGWKQIDIALAIRPGYGNTPPMGRATIARIQWGGGPDVPLPYRVSSKLMEEVRVGLARLWRMYLNGTLEKHSGGRPSNPTGAQGPRSSYKRAEPKEQALALKNVSIEGCPVGAGLVKNDVVRVVVRDVLGDALKLTHTDRLIRKYTGFAVDPNDPTKAVRIMNKGFDSVALVLVERLRATTAGYTETRSGSGVSKSEKAFCVERRRMWTMDPQELLTKLLYCIQFDSCTAETQAMLLRLRQTDPWIIHNYFGIVQQKERVVEVIKEVEVIKTVEVIKEVAGVSEVEKKIDDLKESIKDGFTDTNKKVDDVGKKVDTANDKLGNLDKGDPENIFDNRHDQNYEYISPGIYRLRSSGVVCYRSGVLHPAIHGYRKKDMPQDVIDWGGIVRKALNKYGLPNFKENGHFVYALRVFNESRPTLALGKNQHQYMYTEQEACKAADMLAELCHLFQPKWLFADVRINGVSAKRRYPDLFSKETRSARWHLQRHGYSEQTIEKMLDDFAEAFPLPGSPNNVVDMAEARRRQRQRAEPQE